MSRSLPQVPSVFGIDTRALAAFRVGAGLVVLLDLCLRARSLTAFYTDSGVLPRALHADLFPLLHTLSVHALFGSAVVQAILFGITGVVAVSLVVGYRTTLSTVLSTALLVSLQFRNPLILTAGDLILSVLLLFSIFLPLGARYSLDAVHSGGRQGQVTTVASAGPLLFLAVLVYGVNAVTHLAGDSWVRGDAIEVVFGLESITTFAGEFLRGYPLLLTAFSWLWLGMLVCAPCLILCSGRARSALTLLFIGAHLGILSTLFIVTFPLVNCVGLLLFLPASAWDELCGRAFALRKTGDRPLSTARVHWLYFRRRPPSGDSGRRSTRLLGAVVVVGVLLLITGWAVASQAPLSVSDTDETSVVDYSTYPFAVFSPAPLQTDGWYVAPISLESGLTVDAYTLRPVDWDRPPNLDERLAGPRWTVYLVAGNSRLYAGEKQAVEGFANYLCARTERAYAPQPVNVSVYFLGDAQQDDTTTRRRLLRQPCD